MPVSCPGSLGTLTEPIDIGLLILRVVAGLILLAHGIKHARRRTGTADWFESIGFKAPQLQWFATTATELGVPVLLFAGLLTSLAAAGLIAVMFVAFWVVHRTAGFFITAYATAGVEGWEYVFLLAIVGSVIAVAGPGSISLDDAIGIADNLDGWAGLAISAGGIAAAVGLLAVFWRPADSST